MLVRVALIVVALFLLMGCASTEPKVSEWQRAPTSKSVVVIEAVKPNPMIKIQIGHRLKPCKSKGRK